MYRNTIIEGDSARVLQQVPAGSVDLVVTDPPYLVNYRDRDGRSLRNDDSARGMMPIFDQMARAMKTGNYAICFSGWSALQQFIAAWEAAGLRIVRQLIWAKDYGARRGFAEYRHEMAYLLAKGHHALPREPLPSVLQLVCSGNRRHPTEKAVEILAPLICCFSNPGDLVCDPFGGSGSTSVAATLNGRDYLDIDIDAPNLATAKARLAGVAKFCAQSIGSAAALVAT